VKENMIPSVATATFNHRLIPGASNLTVLKHYQNVLGEDAIVTFNPTTSMPNG
jgi:acetylornithine deacetylase/succinyl-diaminopimelate desuccinylase-like protein